MLEGGNPVVMRRLLRGAGAVGLALLGFALAATLLNEWDEGREGGRSPDGLFLAAGLVVAAAVLFVSLRLPAKRWSYLVLGVGACGLFGGFAGAIIAVGAHLQPLKNVLAPVLLLAGLVVAGLSLATLKPWWNRTDEAARQAHLSGFFWGGTAGAVAVTPLIMAASVEPGSIPAISAMTPDQAFFAGAAVLYAAISVGYGLFWGWWWLSRSRGDGS